MTITAEKIGSAVVARVCGDVTHATSGEFQAKLLGAVQEGCGVVLDLSGVGILTSAGLRALLLLHREAGVARKKVFLAAVPVGVKDVMEVTGFWDHFRAEGSVEDALRRVEEGL